MSALLTRARPLAQTAGERPAHDVAVERPPVTVGARPSSAGFAALLGAYRSSGGTARGDDLARLFADHHHRGDYVSLARVIATGDVFAFEWRQTLWIPMFQFEPRTLAVKQGLPQILAELTTHFDSWSLAAWFANGNASLDGYRPVDLLDCDLPAVLNVARTNRSIAAV